MVCDSVFVLLYCLLWHANGLLNRLSENRHMCLRFQLVGFLCVWDEILLANIGIRSVRLIYSECWSLGNRRLNLTHRLMLWPSLISDGTNRTDVRLILSHQFLFENICQRLCVDVAGSWITRYRWI